MNVYVVRFEEEEYDGGLVVGVYSTLKEAKKHALKIHPKGKCVEVEDTMNLYADLYHAGSHSRCWIHKEENKDPWITIEEWTVKAK